MQQGDAVKDLQRQNKDADALNLSASAHLDVFSQRCNCCLNVLCNAAASVLDEGLLKQCFLRSDFVQTTLDNLWPAQHCHELLATIL